MADGRIPLVSEVPSSVFSPELPPIVHPPPLRPLGIPHPPLSQRSHYQFQSERYLLLTHTFTGSQGEEWLMVLS